MIDISVIIVNWNTKALLLNCVESIYRTTKDSALEIIVIDNASTDGSIEALQLRFPKVQVIVNPNNLGFAKANNIGIEKAKGQYVCLVNSDVLALDGVLDKMRLYMKKNPGVGALAPKTYGGDMEIQKNCSELPNLGNLICDEFLLARLFPNVTVFQGRTRTRHGYDKVMEIDVLSGCFLMVRKEVIVAVGALDDRFFFYSEDVDWCKRMHDAGWQLVYYPGAEAIHFGHGSSPNASGRLHVEMIKANWQYWKKHKSFAACALFWLIKFTGTLGRATGWFIISIVKPAVQLQARANVVGYGKVLKWLIIPSRFLDGTNPGPDGQLPS